MQTKTVVTGRSLMSPTEAVMDTALPRCPNRNIDRGIELVEGLHHARRRTSQKSVEIAIK
jgi:hypothetical protein